MDLYEQYPGSRLASSERFVRFLEIMRKFSITTSDLVFKSVDELAELTTIEGENDPEIRASQFVVMKRILHHDMTRMTQVQRCYSTIRNRHLKAKMMRCMGHKHRSRVEKHVLMPLAPPLASKVDVKELCERFSTGTKYLDSCLGGGIPLGYVTEISGESCTGKTQLLMQMALWCQLPRRFGGLNRSGRPCKIKVLYVSTEAPLPIKRLEQLHGDNFVQNAVFQKLVRLDDALVPSLANISTCFVSNWNRQAEFLIYHQIPRLLALGETKLLIIDSISHHLRSSLNTTAKDADSLYEQKVYNNVYLRKMSDHLTNLARKFNIAIVVSNQVASRPQKVEQLELNPMDIETQLGWLYGWDRFNIHHNQLDIEYQHTCEMEQVTEFCKIYNTDTLVVDEVSDKFDGSDNGKNGKNGNNLQTGNNLQNNSNSQNTNNLQESDNSQNTNNLQEFDNSQNTNNLQEFDSSQNTYNSHHSHTVKESKRFENSIENSIENSQNKNYSQDPNKFQFTNNSQNNIMSTDLPTNSHNSPTYTIGYNDMGSSLNVQTGLTQISLDYTQFTPLLPLVTFNRTVPCLGIDWANRIPIRLFLSATNSPLEVNAKRQEINGHCWFQDTLSGEPFRNRCLKLLDLELLSETGYDKKHFFVKITSSIFGQSGKLMEAVVTKNGYKCFGV